jgi:histidinol-phosphatase (PHP family)
MILSDFHVHPDYSVDAVGTVDEFCEKAVQLGLRAICFTTHYDYNPAIHKDSGHWKFRGSKVKLTDDIVASYVEEVETAKRRFGGKGLDVFTGIEIDYTPGSEKVAERLRSLFSFDFVLGSVHCINGFAISEDNEANEYFGARPLTKMADEYFALLRSAAECRYFDALGHLDYYVRYGRKFYGDDIEYIATERFDSVFDILKRNGIGIEINTSPYKRGEGGFHPSRRILEHAIESGVTISSVGSDSHNPDQLGKGITEAYEFLKSKNVKPRYPR